MVFTDFVRKTLGVTTQRMIDVITNFVKSFGEFMTVNDGEIETFVKDTHSTNRSGAIDQRILISNNLTQGLKSMFFELKDRELCNDLTEEVALCSINSYHIIITRKKSSDAKEYPKNRDNQCHHYMKVPMLTGTNGD